MSESWVDQPKNQIAPPNTWHTLSLNTLLDIKNQLLDKIYMARGKPMYLNPLNEAMAKLEGFISAKMNDSRGA